MMGLQSTMTRGTGGMEVLLATEPYSSGLILPPVLQKVLIPKCLGYPYRGRLVLVAHNAIHLRVRAGP